MTETGVPFERMKNSPLELTPWLVEREFSGGEFTVVGGKGIEHCNLSQSKVTIQKQGVLSQSALFNCELTVEEGAAFVGNYIEGGSHTGLEGDLNRFEGVERR